MTDIATFLTSSIRSLRIMGLTRSLFVAAVCGLAAFPAAAQPQAAMKIKQAAAIGITSDSRHVVVMDTNGKVTRRELPSGEPEVVSSLKLGRTVRGAAMSRGAEFVSIPAADSYHRNPSVWDVADGTVIREFRELYGLALSRNFALAVAWKPVSNDLAAIDIASGAVVSTLTTSSSQVFTVAAISPDGQYVASGHHQGAVQLRDFNSGMLVRELGDLDQKLSAIAFSADGKRIAAGSVDWPLSGSTFVVYDTVTGVSEQYFNAPREAGWPDAIAFSDDGRWLIVGYEFGPILIWDAFTSAVACELKDYGVGNTGPTGVVGFSPDSRYAFANRRDDARVWDVRGCLAKYLHKDAVARELRKSGLFAAKGEFETTEQFNERRAKAAEFEASLVARYAQQFDADIAAAQERVQQKIGASIKTIALSIESRGQYNADKQVFPVIIGGLAEIVKVPVTEARDFKAKYAQAKVLGKSRLHRSLMREELFNIQITNPTSGKKYPFGRQEEAAVTSAAALDAEGVRASIRAAREAVTDKLREPIAKLETTECTEGDLTMPLDAEFSFIVSPARECWTPWVVFAAKRVGFNPSANILIQFALRDGTVSDEIEDGPRKNITMPHTAHKVRFKSLQKEPVTVKLQLH